MAKIPESARQQYQLTLKLEELLIRASRRSWRRVNPDFISESWREQVRELLPVVEQAQVRAASAGGKYSAMALAQQGKYVAPSVFVDPNAFAGYSASGGDLGDLLYSPVVVAKRGIARGAEPTVALLAGRAALDQIAQTLVADAARQAASIDIAARPRTGYVRMVSAGACSRCAILAGKLYRWNEGFLRHPNCNCEHVATTIGDTAEAIANGMIDDPRRLFDSLSEAEQNRRFTNAGAEAIREGADVSQVVNARSGMTANGYFTTSGTRYGYASEILKPGQRRLTPEGIYYQAREFGRDREWVLDRLREHGYILPQGYVPGGALRGQIEGFGQLGAGGRRRAASQAVLDARATGIRDPRNRYTMTAAERRLYDARRDYELALNGISPYRSSPGFGNTPDPFRQGLNIGSKHWRKVTPEELAQAEMTYRAFLESSGNIFTKFDR